MPSLDELRSLASLEPATPVLSVYALTDPRDPANTNHVPGWLIALRNGLRALEGLGRDEELDLRDLRDRVVVEVEALDAAERARSLAWFLTAEGSLDVRFGLQLPLRADLVASLA